MKILRIMRQAVALITLYLISSSAALGQSTGVDVPKATGAYDAGGQGSRGPDVPMPDIPALMRDVEINQRKSEAIQKSYIYHSVDTEEEADGHGAVKKITTAEYDHFWLDGVPVERMVKKNGMALTPDALAKEDKQIDKQVAKARERRAKADAQGNETDPLGNEEITVSRLLELGRFSTPRRVQMNGRPTIEVDYVGDPNAKTRNRSEEIVRDMRGTVWVDEEDRVMVRVQGEFVDSFKIGAGLLISVRKGTHFEAESKKINNEVWLPSKIEGQGQARVLLLFNFNGSLQAIFSDYRKFRATSTVLPADSQTRSFGIQGDPVRP